MLEHHCGQLSKESRTRVETNSWGKREYPVAMIRRLVNDFVHDLHPPQLHMFFSEADHLLSVSPSVFVASPVASPAQETEDHVSPAERERVQKVDSSPPCCRWSRFKDEFAIVASASRLSCLDAAHG